MSSKKSRLTVLMLKMNFKKKKREEQTSDSIGRVIHNDALQNFAFERSKHYHSELCCDLPIRRGAEE
jgi:hypothetical protein